MKILCVVALALVNYGPGGLAAHAVPSADRLALTELWRMEVQESNCLPTNLVRAAGNLYLFGPGRVVPIVKPPCDFYGSTRTPTGVVLTHR